MRSKALLACALWGCAPAATQVPAAAPARAAAQERSASTPSSPWHGCYAGFSPTGNPRHDLERLTKACGSLGGMRAITPIRMGHQGERDPVDRYAFYVPAAGKCYRVYATSSAKVADLDLLLRNPTGDELAADVTEDTWPVLPPREPLCLDAPGLYVLEVSVYRGSGDYAIQVWGT